MICVVLCRTSFILSAASFLLSRKKNRHFTQSFYRDGVAPGSASALLLAIRTTEQLSNDYKTRRIRFRPSIPVFDNNASVETKAQKNSSADSMSLLSVAKFDTHIPQVASRISPRQPQARLVKLVLTGPWRHIRSIGVHPLQPSLQSRQREHAHHFRHCELQSIVKESCLKRDWDIDSASVLSLGRSKLL